MKTFKKTLKYISLSIGVLILAWLSFGFYLYINLPDIEIENGEYKISFSSRANKSDLPINIDPEFVVKSFLPKDKLFKSKKSYSFLFPQLFASSVIIFENSFTPEYSLCIDKLNYVIPIKTGTLFERGVFGDFLGFRYYIDNEAKINGLKEIKDIYPKLGDQENFPFVVKLTEGNSCNKNIISEYNITLNYEDNIIENKSNNYPFDIYNREFILKIMKK